MNKSKKAGYVDGFVLIVPKKKLKAYRAMATVGKNAWMKHGALDYKECIADDLSPDMGGMPALTFTRLAKPKKGEAIVFSYIAYTSKKHRDAVNAKVMKDAAMNDPKFKEKPMPFDTKRMAYGGFRVIVGA